MTRGILIAGNESPLFSAVCDEAGKRIKTYAAALIPQGQQVQSEFSAGHPAAKNIAWNPASPVSARSLILEAEGALEHIDEAVLVCAPQAYRGPPDTIAPAGIDRIIDNNIKCWFFLVRELTLLFKNRRRSPEGAASGGPPAPNGSIVFALRETAGTSREDSDLAGPSAAAAFRALGQSLMLSQGKSPWTAMGFSLPEPGEESAFAAHIFKAMEDNGRNAGKWHRFGKLGIFGR